MSNPAPNFLALRTEFSTFLCFNKHTQALIHLPAQQLAGQALVCTGRIPSQELTLITPGQAPAPFPLPTLPVTYLPNGKILLGQEGAQLAVRPLGETVIQEEPAGLHGEFFRESLTETLASANRRPAGSFRFAIFTAAGDCHQIPLWLTGDEPREFALITAYYGSSDASFCKIRAQSDIALRAAGGKFQILKSLFIRQPGLLQHYDFILVADDDLIWSTAAINRAFRLAETFDLWLCQPAFDPAGRISYPITAQFPGGQSLRYINFVENTCPLFRADKLFAFLNVFDGSMSG